MWTKRKINFYRGADKFLARPGGKQATATEDLSLICPIYNRNWRNISNIYIYIYIYICIKQGYHQMKYSNHQTKYIGK